MYEQKNIQRKNNHVTNQRSDLVDLWRKDTDNRRLCCALTKTFRILNFLSAHCTDPFLISTRRTIVTARLMNQHFTQFAFGSHNSRFFLNSNQTIFCSYCFWATSISVSINFFISVRINSDDFCKFLLTVSTHHILGFNPYNQESGYIRIEGVSPFVKT